MILPCLARSCFTEWTNNHSTNSIMLTRVQEWVVAARPPMTKTKNRRSSPSHALLSRTRRPQLYTTNFRKVSPWKQPTARRESKSKKKEKQTLVTFSTKTFSSSLHIGYTPADLLSPQKHNPTPAPKRRRSRNREIARERQASNSETYSWWRRWSRKVDELRQPGDHDPQQTRSCQYE
jgi:hypothetical protein